MTRWLATLLLVGAASASEPAVDPAPCALSQPEADRSTSASCLECHDARLAAPRWSHPVELEYRPRATAPGRPRLRPADEVIRRGVFLRDGKVECLTCHDGRSTWAFRIASPAGPEGQGGDVRQALARLCRACHEVD